MRSRNDNKTRFIVVRPIEKRKCTKSKPRTAPTD